MFKIFVLVLANALHLVGFSISVDNNKVIATNKQGNSIQKWVINNENINISFSLSNDEYREYTEIKFEHLNNNAKVKKIIDVVCANEICVEIESKLLSNNRLDVTFVRQYNFGGAKIYSDGKGGVYLKENWPIAYFDFVENKCRFFDENYYNKSYKCNNKQRKNISLLSKNIKNILEKDTVEKVNEASKVLYLLKIKINENKNNNDFISIQKKAFDRYK